MAILNVFSVTSEIGKELDFFFSVLLINNCSSPVLAFGVKMHPRAFDVLVSCL